jgi:hypothetical protein
VARGPEIRIEIRDLNAALTLDARPAQECRACRPARADRGDLIKINPAKLVRLIPIAPQRAILRDILVCQISASFKEAVCNG